MDKLKRTDERESYCIDASVDQRIGHPAFTRNSAGSSPAGGTEGGCNMIRYLQWLEELNRRAFEALRVPKQFFAGSMNENHARSPRTMLRGA